MDELSRQFFQDYDSTNSDSDSNGDYFLYRNRESGEIETSREELPLEFGLPPTIEEGTPEALNYKQRQIEVYGFPRRYLQDDFIEERKKQQQETVVTDPAWSRASKILYKYMEPDKDDFKSDAEAASWGVDFMSRFENSLTYMLIDVNRLESAPPAVAHSMYYLMETADRKGVLASNFFKGLYNTITDPSMLIGLGSFGIGYIGKQAGKQFTKLAFKDRLKDIVFRKPDATDLFLAGEGALYAATDDFKRQQVEIAAEKQNELSLGRLATSAGIGAAGGIGFNRAGEVIGETFQTATKSRRGQANETPSSEDVSARKIDESVDDTAIETPKEEPKPEPFEVPDNPFTGKNTKPFSLATSKEELIEGAKIAEDARTWYTRHNETIAELFGEDTQLFKELIGVTSQQASVDENIARAIMVYDYLKTHGTFSKLKAKTKNVKNPTEHHLPLLSGVVGNLRRLEGVDPSATGRLATQKNIRERMGLPPTKTTFGIETYLGGNKVPDFVEAMFEGTDEVVTMDRHMIQILFGKKQIVNNSSMAEGKRIVTEIANELGWTPKETQAAIWSFNQIKDSDIVKRKKVDLTDVRDYKKAIEERRDAILELTTKFRDTEGQSQSVQSRSNAVGEDTGATNQSITTNETGVDTPDPPDNIGGN